MKKKLTTLLAALAVLAAPLLVTVATAPPASAAPIAKACIHVPTNTFNPSVNMCMLSEFVMTAAGPVRTVNVRLRLEGSDVDGVDSNPAVTIHEWRVRSCKPGTFTTAPSCTWETVAGSAWDGCCGAPWQQTRSSMTNGVFSGNIDKKGNGNVAVFMAHYTIHINNAPDHEVWQGMYYGATSPRTACQVRYLDDRVGTCPASWF